MKIVSWNCRQGLYLHEKFKKIQELDADIYVILEVNKPKKVSDDYKKFIDTLKKRSLHNYNSGVTADSNIITLSTCTITDGERLVVHAYLL